MKPVSPVWVQGKASRQAHRDLPEGTYEREIGRDGFGGPASHIYHQRPPTDWDQFDGPLKPRAFTLNQTTPVDSPFDALEIVANHKTAINYWYATEPMSHLVRNADGDMLLFIHAGAGQFFCDYGHLTITVGDYLLIPKGTMWRIDDITDLRVLIVETSRMELPDRGLLGQHALFDPARLDIPKINATFLEQQNEEPWKVIIKRRKNWSVIGYSYNPLDAVGWKGTLAPIRLNIGDILPVSSHRYHLPPSVHSTFESDELIVSTFAPRPFETDPTALKVPFFHSNDDIDELIFYHHGDFFSRDHIEPGMLSFHPAGFTHGPHPKALKNMFEQKDSNINEYAVMIDARTPLDVVENDGRSTHARDCASDLVTSTRRSVTEFELPHYAESWKY